MTEQTFEQLLDIWVAKAKQVKKLDAEEKELRKRLFAAAFPTPKEGANSRDLVDGRKLKGTHKINRTIDDASVQATIAEIRSLGRNDIVAEDIFIPTFKLSIGGLKKAPDDVRKIAEKAVIAKPGTPELKVE